MSRKAVYLASRLRQLGFEVEIPALDGNDFAGLTISRQMDLVRPYLDAGPLSLIGSSLGGYLAALLAARSESVQRLVLLAPAFDFYRLWVDELGPDRLAEWEHTGTVEIYHYGADRKVPLRFDLMRDAAKFEPFPDFQQPALLFHGEADSVVPIGLSEGFAAAHPNCHFFALPSGHELTNVLDRIWAGSETFLTAARL